MGPPAWLSAFLLCCLSVCSQLSSAQLVVTAPAAAPGPSSVAAPTTLTGGALNLPNVQQLIPGVLTTVQNVTFKTLNFYYFRLPNATVDITVQLIQYQGDADLYIVEPQNPTPFSNNGFAQNGWESATAQNESIFIPRTDPFYSTGVYAVGVQGYAKGTSQYQLLVTFTSQKRVLVPDQKAALQTMLTACCGNATAGACGNWVGDVVDDTGAIATEMCEVPGWLCTVDGLLQVADFTVVGLTCPFPWSTLGALTSLTVLRLSNNSLTGTVDWLQLAKLPNLQVLTLDLNQFTGSVTCDLATPGTPLLEFNVATNNFNGSLPACYIQKPEMRILWFNNNQFTGTLPSTIPANSEFRAFHAANAGVTGNLTAEFGLPANLQTLELSQNYITGTIPDGIVGPRLDALLLNNNELTGPIPTSLTTAPQMRTLFLNNNQLTGGIADFANAAVLQQVFLEVNNLTGAFPQTWNTPSLISLEVSNNFLSGGIPLSLLTVPNLFAFAAANNLLSGALPDLGSSKSAVRIFNVTSNQLTGPIPASYSALPVFDTRSAKLDPTTGNILSQIFDASYNILTGSVPSFFESTRLPAWTFVDLAGNELTCNGTSTTIANVACGAPAGVSTGGSAGPFATKGPASGAGAPVATPVPGVVTINPVVNTPSPSAAAAAALAGGTTSSSAVPVVNNSDGGSSGLSTGAIVGIVVGILVGVIAVVALAVFAVARVTRQRREAVSAKSFKRFASMDAEPV